MIDPNTYRQGHLIQSLVNLVNLEIPEDYLPLFYCVVDEDDSIDLTNIHPRDRTNINLYTGRLVDIFHGGLEQKLLDQFPQTLEFSKAFDGIIKIELIAIGPNSIIPLHLDDMSRPQFDTNNNWYSVFVGIHVPSDDSNIIGVQIDKEIYNHTYGKAIVFDTQIPHCAWNNSDKWWLSVRLSVLKEFFN
jgi:hypothetical protein